MPVINIPLQFEHENSTVYDVRAFAAGECDIMDTVAVHCTTVPLHKKGWMAFDLLMLKGWILFFYLHQFPSESLLGAPKHTLQIVCRTKTHLC